jgi:hypothetical protein
VETLADEEPGMGRLNYMMRRRECKRLWKRRHHLQVAIRQREALAGGWSDTEVREKFEGVQTLDQLQDLMRRANLALRLYQARAWLARRSCLAKGGWLPPLHKSERGEFEGMSTEDISRYAEILEAQVTASTEILLAEGRV